MRPFLPLSFLLLAAGAAPAGPAPASCAEIALLANGQSLEIAGHAQDGEGNWLLDLGPGSSLVLSRFQVLGFEQVPADPPAPGPVPSPGPETLDQKIARLAREMDVEPGLVSAVIAVESDGDPFAVSPKGAAGLMQLMPGTARTLGVRDVFDPEQNLRAGITHLKSLLDRYGHDYGKALAAYNAGAGAVDRHGGIPPYRETTNYVIRILERLLGK